MAEMAVKPAVSSGATALVPPTVMVVGWPEESMPVTTS